MQVITVNSMPDGTKIQIEDWSEDYDFHAQNSTIGAYPIAQVNGKQFYSPKRGRTFRLSFNFFDEAEARKAFDELLKGEKQLIDFKKHVNNKRLLEFL